MIIKIFTGPVNYDITSLYDKDDNEYIIGVDQGCKLLLNHGIDIDLAVGDFDSITKNEFELIKKVSEKVQILDKDKNYSDTYFALKEALKLTHDEIIIYGGIGGRMDHTLANMTLLTYGNISFRNNECLMFALDAGIYNIENSYKYISFFPVEDIENFTLSGFEYEIDNADVKIEDPRLLSNEGSGTVSFDKGTVIVVMQNE